MSRKHGHNIIVRNAIYNKSIAIEIGIEIGSENEFVSHKVTKITEDGSVEHAWETGCVEGNNFISHKAAKTQRYGEGGKMNEEGGSVSERCDAALRGLSMGGNYEACEVHEGRRCP